MTTTVSTALKENSRRALKGLAVFLSLIVYLAGLIYAGVRSYSLFARTVDGELLPLAVLGIIALEVSALALPLAIHYWTAPGAQRLAALGFYLLDLALIVANAILDAAHHSGAAQDVPIFLNAYGVYAVPALPVVCMIGWAILWALDPASREHDMVQAVRAATHEALMAQIARAAESVDITHAVEDAAGEAARALVGETLGRAPRRIMTPPPMLDVGPKPTEGHRETSTDDDRYLGPGGTREAMMPVSTPTNRTPRKPSRNGNTPDPKDAA